MLTWLPDQELADAVGLLDGVRIEVNSDWHAGPRPASADDVEAVVVGQYFRGDATAGLARLPRLRVVQALSAGVDHLERAVPEGVMLLNAGDVHTPSTAEWVCAAVLACTRALPGFVHEQAAGRWSPRVTGTLAGSRVTVVGAGSIGLAVRDRLAPFGCRFELVAGRARPGIHGPAALPALLPFSDVVVLTVPLTALTTGLVDARFLASMPDGALLVNASRGPVVDTAALLSELNSGRLRAALDVVDPEPLPAGHGLWSAPGLLMTPHVGGAVGTTLQRQAKLLARRLPRLAAWLDVADTHLA